MHRLVTRVSSILIQILLLSLLPSATAHGLSSSPRIWPACQVEKYANETLYFASRRPEEAFKFKYVGRHWTQVEEVLEAARIRFILALHNKMPALDEDPGATAPSTSWSNHLHDATELSSSSSSSSSVVAAAVTRIHITTADVSLQHGVDESYQLHISSSSKHPVIRLQAATVYGVLHGLQTLLQLVEYHDTAADEPPTATDSDDLSSRTQHPQRHTFYIRDTPIYIKDTPLYPYRGLLIDTSRHYLPVDLILRNFDAMAMTKLNVLHWHLTDSPSWPWASRLLPELAQQGAYCRECVYTSETIRSVIREAAMRGIRVVVEVDLPGHCQSIGASHPELLTDCGGDMGPSEPLDVTKPAVYSLVKTIYHGLDTLVIDNMIHIGGDEVSLDCWKTSTKIQKWMRRNNVTDEAELLGQFESFLLNLTIHHFHKQPVVWQDILDVRSVDLPTETIIDVWKDWLPESRNKATMDHKVLYSACWYLDHLDQDWYAFYQCDPRNFNGTKEQKANIIGGHASMWGERVDESNFMARVWPRASATAEKLWTGISPTASDTAFQRLARFRCLMLEQEMEASPIWTGTCGQSLQHSYDEPLVKEMK